MSATLDYMMVDGRCVHVREYLGVQPDQRPTGTCPAKDCAAPVIFVIGTQVTPHVRHKAGEGCSYEGATIAETVEHINAKCHLYNLLQACSALTLSAQCSARHSRRWQWDVPVWDRVEMEHTIGNVRPDIVLFAGEKRMAVEIVHSHSVSDAKRRKLAEIGIPWIEVDTKLALLWTGNGAIRIAKADLTTMPECPDCIAVEARRKAREQARLREAMELKAEQERQAQARREAWLRECEAREAQAALDRQAIAERQAAELHAKQALAAQDTRCAGGQETQSSKALDAQRSNAHDAQIAYEQKWRRYAERQAQRMREVERAEAQEAKWRSEIEKSTGGAQSDVVVEQSLDWSPMFASMQAYFAARQWSEEQTVERTEAERARFAAERRATKAHWDRVWDEAAAAQAARTSAQG